MNWRELNKNLSGLDEDQVKAMLDAEMAAGRRVTIVERLHQRYSALRATRERLALLQACGEHSNG
jgi:hypothetical protein